MYQLSSLFCFKLHLESKEKTSEYDSPTVSWLVADCCSLRLTAEQLNADNKKNKFLREVTLAGLLMHERNAHSWSQLQKQCASIPQLNHHQQLRPHDQPMRKLDFYHLTNYRPRNMWLQLPLQYHNYDGEENHATDNYCLFPVKSTIRKNKFLSCSLVVWCFNI